VKRSGESTIITVMGIKSNLDLFVGSVNMERQCGQRYKKQSRGKVIPLLAWTSPEGSWRLRIQEVQDSRYMKVVRLSALYTGRLYPPEDTTGTHFC